MASRLLVLFLSFLLWGSSHALAGAKKRQRGLPRTEVDLMNNVLACLTHKDSVSYFYLFPPFDTLWAMVLHNPDKSPETVKALENLREHPQSLIEFDPYYNRSIIGRFRNILQKGEDSGINWENVVMQRYELHKAENTLRVLQGFEKIAPERFMGYMFLRDVLGRSTFCVTISEIQKINGYFFGGQVINILEASSIDEFMRKEREEHKYLSWLAKNAIGDSTALDSGKKAEAMAIVADSDTSAEAKRKKMLSDNVADDEKANSRKEVVLRKYYEGKLDDEIPVKLYVRYMKDATSAGKVVAYDGLYKFGDQDTYVKLNIIRNPDGKWIMDDDAPLGSFDLELSNKTYTGSWTNIESQTGYDAVLKQTDLPQKKMEKFEGILDRGQSGRIDEDNIIDLVERDKEQEKKNTDGDAQKDNTTDDEGKSRRQLRKEEHQRKQAEQEKRDVENFKKEKAAREKADKEKADREKAKKEDADKEKNKDAKPAPTRKKTDDDSDE